MRLYTKIANTVHLKPVIHADSHVRAFVAWVNLEGSIKLLNKSS